MSSRLDELTRDLEKGPPATFELSSVLGRLLPDDYLQFIGTANGAKGFVGKQFLRLWNLDSLEEMNVAAGTPEFWPHLLLFGTDGGGQGFGFDFSGPALRIVEVPLESLLPEDAIEMGTSFTEFIEYLAAS